MKSDIMDIVEEGLKSATAGGSAATTPSGAPAAAEPEAEVAPETELRAYIRALDRLNEDPEALLEALLARDRIAAWLLENQWQQMDQARRLVAYDKGLRERVSASMLRHLPDWRASMQPPDTAWWWFLDQRLSLPWYLLAAIFALFTATMAAEIIRRLWSGVPDTYAIFGTLFILLLTASPLLKQGRELTDWSLDRLSFFRQRQHMRGPTMAVAAGGAFTLIVVVWLLLPAAARALNNRGAEELAIFLNEKNSPSARQHLAEALWSLEMATALDPEQETAYQNLAEVYKYLARPDDALAWYRSALNRDATFVPAYAGLSRLYNQRGEAAAAEQMALAGLEIGCTALPAIIDDRLAEGLPLQERAAAIQDAYVAYVLCHDLYANLGLAAFAQAKSTLAETAFSKANDMESPIRDLIEALYDLSRTAQTQVSAPEDFCPALPHYYLAQLYEQQAAVEQAIQHYEAAAGCLTEGVLVDAEWLADTRAKLKSLKAGTVPE